MTKRSTQLCILLMSLLTAYSVKAQIVCPTNIDFEQGNYSNWSFYTGSCCPINTPTLSGQIINRHTLTNGTATDPYGGFPIVAPGGGIYSLRLGNSFPGAQAERARYYVHVPAGVNNYSLIYRYAVVFENPNHTAAEQPRFEVKAYDSATNTLIPCSQHSYVASANLPGFMLSALGTQVWYKSWTTASLDLSGQAGKTIAVDFASGDCVQAGHFGYGYVDMSCSLFQITTVNCNSAATTPLNAPPGFQTYTWYDANYSSVVATGQNVTIPTPTASTQYHVVLTPYTGYGCPDTLTTTINVASLTVAASNDTTICQGGAASLNGSATSSSSGIAYAWAPATGLSCTSCTNPIATPGATTAYTLTVNDANGCTKQDTVVVSIDQVNGTITGSQAPCLGSSNGSITVVGNSGVPPYSYQWNTTPAQTTATATGLTAGTYSVTINDGKGCSKTISHTIAAPATSVTANISNIIPVSCNGQSNGSLTAAASGGTAPYSYSWSTQPAQTTATITGLAAGSYILTATDSHGCSDTATATITQPAALAVNTSTISPPCSGGPNGQATASVTGGTLPYSYSWNTTPVQTGATATGLSSGNYTVTITDAHGCSSSASASVSLPSSSLSLALISKTDLACNGGNSGSATVTATGGTAPYNYSWNTSPVQTGATASNLTAGNYVATVTDANGCSDTVHVTIAQPAALSTNIAVSSVFCSGGNNGTATAVVSGGTAPYTYLWNTTPAQTTAIATNLSVGNYSVTVTDAHNCTVTASAAIAPPATPLSVAMGTPTNVQCYGGNTGSATVQPSGGAAPYSYSWSTTPAQTTATASGLAAGTYTVLVTDSYGCTGSSTVTIGQPSSLPSLSLANATQVNCEGGSNGSATVSATGGTAPYSYAWNTTPSQTTTSAINLSAGSYVATVTDAYGCTATTTVNITEPTPVSLSASGTNPLCFGAATGTATALATGGTAPYQYSWNSTPVQNTGVASGLTAGTYQVIATDAHGCKDTTTTTLTQPTQLTGSTSFTNASCFGINNGSATAVASGGTAPYSYSWNTTPVQNGGQATNLSAGSYQVTITDANGCVANASATVQSPAASVTATVVPTDVSCYGGSNGAATVSATGGTAPYTYSWNTTPAQAGPGATGLSAGNYIVTATDALGCADTATVSIAQPSALSTNASWVAPACSGYSNGTASVTATGGTAPYSYNWNTWPVQATQSATGLQAGVYAVIVTDNNGCSKTDTVTVTDPSAVSVNVVNITDVNCFGGSNGSAIVTASGGNPSYTYAWNTVPAQNGSNATNLAAGSYVVTATDANGCTGLATATVSQPDPLTSIVTTISPFCSGGNSGTATAIPSGGTPPYSFNWNTSPAQNGAVAINLTPSTYVVSITDQHGCSTTDTAIIGQPTSPISATISSSIAPSCYGAANGSATAAVTGGAAPFTYQWSTVPVQTNASAINLTAGTYSVIVADANGCSDTASVTITQPPSGMSLTVVSQTDATCYGATNGSATVQATGGTTPYAYSWTTSPVQNAVSATALGAGTYTVTVSDANGCSASQVVTISQPSAVQATVAISTPISCFGSADAVLNSSATGGTAPYSYSWNTTPIQTTTNLSNIGQGNYTLTVTDAHGCQDTAQVNVTQPQALGSTLSANDIKCFNGTGGASLAVAGGTAPYTYSWNTTPVQTGAAATGLSAGTYVVTVTDAHNCHLFDTVQLIAPSALSAIIDSASDVLCFGGGNGMAAGHALGGTAPYSYTWNTTPVQQTPTALNLLAGNYIFTVTDTNGCADTAHVSVNEPQEIIATASPLQNTCPSTNNGAATISASGGTPGYTYSWNTTPVQTGSTANQLYAGTYTITVTDARGCNTNTTVTISNYDLPDVDAGADQSLCSGSTVQLQASGAIQYQWSPATGLSCTQCADPIANPAANMMYTVTGTDAHGCVDSDQVNVNLVFPQEVEIGEDRTICAGDTVHLFAGGGIEYTWSPANSLMQANSATPIAMPNETTEYQVIIRENECFSDTMSIKVTVYPKPTISLGPDIKGLSGSFVTLNATTTNATRIVWEPADGLSCDDCYNPRLQLEKGITYLATVSNEAGCKASDDIKIEVGCDNSVLFIPNTFTPNSDGNNDRFLPIGEGIRKIDRLEVYSRWGQLLYRAENIQPGDVSRGWDGTFEEKQLKPDVFVYMVHAECLNGDKVFAKGDISLIR